MLTKVTPIKALHVKNMIILLTREYTPLGSIANTHTHAHRTHVQRALRLSVRNFVWTLVYRGQGTYGPEVRGCPYLGGSKSMVQSAGDRQFVRCTDGGLSPSAECLSVITSINTSRRMQSIFWRAVENSRFILQA